MKACGYYLVEGIGGPTNGLLLEAEGLGNPFRYGFIGSSDTHTGAGSYDESNYFAKVGLLDSTAALRGSVPITDDEIKVLGRVDLREEIAEHVVRSGC